MENGFLVAVTVMTVIAFAKTTALPGFTADVGVPRLRSPGNQVSSATN
jgi:hypothetical protein